MQGNGSATAEMPESSGVADESYLIPRADGEPVMDVTTYRSLFFLDAAGETKDAAGETKDAAGKTKESGTPSALGMTDPFTDAADAPFDTPAVGVLLLHEQGWAQGGLALGSLLHSICLAPGEVTQVAVIDWQRETAGTSREQTEQDEAVSSQADQKRSVSEVQHAVANEAQSGGSTTSASSGTMNAGASLGGLFASATVSASGSTTSALTAQHSVGSRSLAADSTNAIAQRTAEISQAVRSRRAATVREISEHEAETLSSRVLVNYNRRHALNVEYFEVLQLYRTTTHLRDWERCLFVPMKPIDFSDGGTLKKHRAVLLQILAERGETELATTLAAQTAEAANARSKAEIAKEIETAAEDVRRLEKDKLWVDFVTPKYDALIDLAARYSVATYSAAPDPSARAKLQRDFNALAQQVSFEGKVEDGTVKLLERHASYLSLKSSLPGQITEAKRRLDQLRTELATAAVPVGERLNLNQLVYSQEIWLRMEPYRISKLLAGRSVDGEALTHHVDPTPIGVYGNYLALPWRFEAPAKRESFARTYLGDAKGDEHDAANMRADTVAVSTSGVFAEAVLGRGEAAEKIDSSRLWQWDKSPIPILPPKIADLSSASRARDLNLDSHGLESALAGLRAQALADSSHLGQLVTAVTSGNAFRDMGGLASGASLAEKLGAITGAGATQAGKQAAEIQAKMLDTFVAVLDSDVGKAAVAEFMLPGAGPAVLQATEKLAARPPADKPGASSDKGPAKAASSPSKGSEEPPKAPKEEAKAAK